jgi:sulfur carrier protein
VRLVEITVNGERKSVAKNATAADLLESLGVPAETAVVSLNGEVLSRDDLDSKRLSEGDSVDMFAFVGGG